MQFTFVTANFLVAVFFKSKKKQIKCILIMFLVQIMFYLTHYSQNIHFNIQSVLKLSKYFFFFLTGL